MNEITFTSNNYTKYPAEITVINEGTVLGKTYITGLRLKTDVPLKDKDTLILNMWKLKESLPASDENVRPYIFAEVVTEYERTSGTGFPDTYEYVVNFDDKYLQNAPYQAFFKDITENLDIREEEIGFDRW